jgi:predicted SAM-dependent methyltransferase
VGVNNKMELDIGSGIVGNPYHSFLEDERVCHVDINKSAYHLEVIGDIEHLPFRDSCVDVIHARHIFEHLRNPFRALEECYRVLEKRGVLVLSVPNGSFFKWKSSGRTHFYSWNQYTLKNFLEQKFNDVRIETSMRSLGGRKRKLINLLLSLFMGENELNACASP